MLSTIYFPRAFLFKLVSLVGVQAIHTLVTTLFGNVAELALTILWLIIFLPYSESSANKTRLIVARSHTVPPVYRGAWEEVKNFHLASDRRSGMRDEEEIREQYEFLKNELDDEDMNHEGVRQMFTYYKRALGWVLEEEYI